jgi:hypothetical protein
MFRSMARALYLLTGVVTAVPVLWALAWAVWGAGVRVSEYLSLVGSVLLLVAAGSSRRRFAARLALVGTVAVWSFYLPGVLGLVRTRLTDQELRLTVLFWTPKASPLVIVQQKQVPGAPDMTLSTGDIQRIKDTGITGTASVFSANGLYGSGKKSSVILIIQGPIRGPVELREPDATSIVYLQEREHWRMFPSNARTLERKIRISPDSIMVELSTGASQGFGTGRPPEASQDRDR